MVVYKCDKCGKVFDKKFNYDSHKSRKKPCKIDNQITPQTHQNNTANVSMTNENAYVCKYCKHEFKYQRSLHRHLIDRCKVKKQMNEEKENMCNILLKKIEMLEKLNQEMKNQNEKINIEVNKIKLKNIVTCKLKNTINLPHVINKSANNNEKMIRLLKEKNVRVVDKNVRVKDFLSNIIQTKNHVQYIDRNIKDAFVVLDGFKYISLEKCKELLENTNRAEAKQILEKLNMDENDDQTLINLQDSVFKYKGQQMTIIKDIKNDDIWIKGKDVARILGYDDTKNAIDIHVSADDKIDHEKICKLFGSDEKSPPKSLDKKTIFINESGLYSLMLSSKKPEAKVFKRWVTKEVLPSLRKYGQYVIPNKPFYYDNLLCDYDNKNVVYIGYIGISSDGEHLYKYGKSTNIYARDVNSHKKTFKQFDIVHIIECDNKDIIEQKFKKELQAKGLQRDIMVNDKKQTEIFTITNEHNLQSVVETLTNLVAKYPLAAIENHKQDILIEKEKTRQVELQLKMKEIERDTKKAELKTKEVELKTKETDLKILEIQVALKQKLF